MTLSYIFLIILIPLIAVALLAISYSYYINLNKKNKLIQKLKKDNNSIIDTSHIKAFFTIKERTWLSEKLSYAGFPSPFAEYAFLFISAICGFSLSSFLNYVVSNNIIYFLSAVIFSFLPLLILFKIIESRLNDFNFGLKVLIDKVTSMMKSGMGFDQALKKSVQTSKSKLTRDTFNIYLSEKDIISEDKCFAKMFKLVESKELRIFYLTISIGRQSGGKFSNTLVRLREALHEQGEIKQEIASSTREIRIGSYMIVAITVFIFEMMDRSVNGSLRAHFFETSEGQVQMFLIVLWVCFGLFINGVISKVK